MCFVATFTADHHSHRTKTVNTLHPKNAMKYILLMKECDLNFPYGPVMRRSLLSERHLYGKVAFRISANLDRSQRVPILRQQKGVRGLGYRTAASRPKLLGDTDENAY